MDWLDLLAVQGTRKSLLPTPQCKTINYLALSHLYGLTVTFVHDYWKKCLKLSIKTGVKAPHSNIFSGTEKCRCGMSARPGE